jgi:hypothetical protein
MPFEQRRLVSRMLVDGATYAQIDAEIRRQFPGAPTLHASSLSAWQRSAEFVRYRTARERDDAESAELRAVATAMNDGQGPTSVADLTAMEVLRALWAGVKGGQVSDFGDLAQVTRALAPILRAQIAQESVAAKRREADLAAEIGQMKAGHAAEIAVLQEQLAARDAEIERLRTPAPEDLTGLSEAEKNRRIKERLGIV